MLIGFDASRAFVNEATGTENYSLNLLRALAKIDRKNRYRVYVRSVGSWDGRTVGKKSRSNYPTIQLSNYPDNFEFVKVSPNRLWTQIGLALETWRNPVDVLFIPAHTLPVLRKRKILLGGKGKEAGLVRGLGERLKAPNPKTLNKTGFLTYKPLTKYVVTIHDLGVEYLPGYHSFPGRYYLDLASRYAAREAEAIIAVSKATKKDLVSRYKVASKKVHVVGEGVDLRFFRPKGQKEIQKVKSRYKISGNYVLAVGTVQPRKNLEMLIKAFKQVSGMVGRWDGGRKARPTILQSYNPTDLKLVIAGKLGWYYQKIIDLPKKLGIRDKVRFLGYVKDADLPSLYSGAVVFASPSLFEGFDLPILEALACGCYVAASDIVPHREIFAKVAGPVSRFPPAYAEASAGKPASKSSAALPLEAKRSGVGSPSTTATRKNNNSSLHEPMILAKPKDTRQWTHFLYQYISLYNNRLILASKEERVDVIKKVLASQFSWQKAARETLKVLEEISLK